MTPELTYSDPWTGIDRGPYRRAWIGLSALFLTGPIQIAALGAGVFFGFTANDPTFLRWALIASIVFMVINIVFYHHVSKKCDEVTWEVNERMWRNVSESVRQKYGHGILVPVDDEPKKVGPPDGSNGFWSKAGRFVFGDDCKVLWSPSGEAPKAMMLSVQPETFEPTLAPVPEKTKSAKNKG